MGRLAGVGRRLRGLPGQPVLSLLAELPLLLLRGDDQVEPGSLAGSDLFYLLLVEM